MQSVAESVGDFIAMDVVVWNEEIVNEVRSESRATPAFLLDNGT